MLQVSTLEFLAESFFVVDEPVIALLVAHLLWRTLRGESVIGSRICTIVNYHERGKIAWQLRGTNLKRTTVFASLMLVVRCQGADEGNLQISAFFVSFDCCGNVGGKMMRWGVG